MGRAYWSPAASTEYTCSQLVNLCPWIILISRFSFSCRFLLYFLGEGGDVHTLADAVHFFQASHFMRNGDSNFLMIMTCDFVLVALCLLSHSVKLPLPHQEISELRFVLLFYPALFVEFFCVCVLCETVSIATFVSYHSKLFFRAVV